MRWFGCFYATQWLSEVLPCGLVPIPGALLQCEAQLGYSDLVLSRCRSRLAVITALPDFQLSIWDWEAESVEIKYQLGVGYTGESKD